MSVGQFVPNSASTQLLTVLFIFYVFFFSFSLVVVALCLKCACCGTERSKGTHF